MNRWLDTCQRSKTATVLTAFDVDPCLLVESRTDFFREISVWCELKEHNEFFHPGVTDDCALGEYTARAVHISSQGRRCTCGAVLAIVQTEQERRPESTLWVDRVSWLPR